MDRWVGKVALVTGASAGIGAAIAEELVKHGMKVVGFARRVERVEEIKNKLTQAKGELFPYKGDVSNTQEVETVFKWIEEKFGAIHVLVNNAGIARSCTITDGDLDLLKDVINVNLVGLVACSQQAIRLMKKTGVNDGHIININSVAGHQVISLPVPSFNVYPATKHGVTALTETLRQELRYMKTNIRVTSISPGVVETEIGQAAHEASGPSQMEPSKEYLDFLKSLPMLESKDIADAVVFALQTPPHVQIHELTIKPVGEPF